jgi:hypothetical protein
MKFKNVKMNYSLKRICIFINKSDKLILILVDTCSTFIGKVI